MLRAMVFIDFENFQINLNNYYKSLGSHSPKLDYNVLPMNVVNKLMIPHVLVKTFLFAPKPDAFLMDDNRRSSTYSWISGMKNQDRFTVVEGTHAARPVSGFTYKTMSIDNPASYYVTEKGTDVNIAVHMITKGFMNSYDTAILMSGDTDYLPVLDILNTLGKSVVVVGISGQYLQSFKHRSDEQIILDKTFFDSCLRG